jgi:hypothetical protein
MTVSTTNISHYFRPFLRNRLRLVPFAAQHMVQIGRNNRSSFAGLDRTFAEQENVP